MKVCRIIFLFLIILNFNTQAFDPDMVDLIIKNRDELLGRKTFPGEKESFKAQIEAREIAQGSDDLELNMRITPAWPTFKRVLYDESNLLEKKIIFPPLFQLSEVEHKVHWAS